MRIRSRPENSTPTSVKSGAVNPITHEIVKQQEDPHPHRQPQADRSRPCLLLARQFRGEDGDEDDVVDAEDDLEHREGQQGDPDLRICQQFHRRIVAESPRRT